MAGSATRLCVLRGHTVRKIGGGTTYEVSPLFSSDPPVGAPKPQENSVARRLTALLLRDEIWLDEGLPLSFSQIDFQPDFVFRFLDPLLDVKVSVDPKSRGIHFFWKNTQTNAFRIDRLPFDPIGAEMIAPIKEAFPGDAEAQALTLVPRPTPALIMRPPLISETTWSKITALRPGMTRFDVNPWFDGEGGMAGRFFQGFYLRESGMKRDPYVKLVAMFAPLEADLIWRNGRGFFLRPEDKPIAATGHERLMDIITYLSPLYLDNGLVMD